jgi:hypothetical protein
MSQSHLLTSPPPPGSAMPCHAIPPAKHRHSTAQHRQAGMAPSQQSGHTHPLSRSTEVCLRLQKTAKKPHAQPRATGGAGIRDMQERGGGGDSLGRKDAPPVTDQANPGQSSPSDPSIHQQPTRPPAICLFVCLSVVCAGGRHGHGVYGGRRKGRGGVRLCLQLLRNNQIMKFRVVGKPASACRRALFLVRAGRGRWWSVGEGTTQTDRQDRSNP